MHIKKAVITAAARGARLYPVGDTVQKAMLPIVDLDGVTKPVLQIIAEEALNCGMEEICIVCAPGDEERYRQAFAARLDHLQLAYPDESWAEKEGEKLQNLVKRLTFAVQEEPKGYGHAVYAAKSFVDDEPFLLLLGDYLYISTIAQACAQQLLNIATQEKCSIAAVNPTVEHLIGRYGTLTGRNVPNQKGLYEIERIIEKPSLSKAELYLQTPGLRLGYYLCLFGMHVLKPLIFSFIEEEMKASPDNVLLTPALQKLAEMDRYLALEVQGNRYDLGKEYGLMQAQIAFGLAGDGNNQVLRSIVDSLAQWQQKGDDLT